MKDDDDRGYKLVLAFDQDDPEFVRGFEAGRFWETLKANEEPFEETLHTANAEMVLRMCEAQNRNFTADILDDTWMVVKID